MERNTKDRDISEVKEFLMPVLAVDEERDAEGIMSLTLLNFYKDLGWDNKNQNLNPQKVKISKGNYEKIVELFRSIDDIRQEAVTVFCLNYMPSVSDNVSDNKVHILTDAMK